ncbi:MAG TPA: TetR/AcrR family transcriptional regulator [Puia sp.]|nr:TetR/AcrR family transcriptional regulator [Puia sp.]
MSVNDHIKEEDIQEQILLAAKQLFQKHGLRKVTMDDVAKVVGKGRSSLYYYYKSKEEILDAVVDAEIRGMLKEVTCAVELVPTAEQKIHAFFLTRLKHVQGRRAFFNAMDIGMDAAEMSDLNKTKQAIHQRIMKLESALLDQILTGGMEKGELRVMNQKDKEAMIFVLLNSLHGIKREVVIDNDFSRIDFLVDALTRMVIDGLRR